LFPFLSTLFAPSLSYFLSYHKKTKITICFPADGSGNNHDLFSVFNFFAPSNWHTIGTTLARFCSFLVKASMLYLVQSKYVKQPFSIQGDGCFRQKGGGFTLPKAISNTMSKAAGRASPHTGRPGRNPASIPVIR
jgi:hypothetical protein